MPDKVEARQERRGANQIAGALAGASLIAISQLLTSKHLDCPLQWAVGFFAVLIPALSGLWFYRPRKGDDPEQLGLALVSGSVYTAVAFAFVFFHFGRIQGVLFVLTALLFWMATARGRARHAVSATGVALLFPLRLALRIVRGLAPTKAINGKS